MSASEFFKQLTAFSEKIFQKIGIDERESPWGGEEFRDHPTGAVVHFTSGDDPYKAIKWFMRKEYDAQVSAHVVVADGWRNSEYKLAKDYPLVAALPAMVVQCVPHNRVAWHATWANEFSFGLELVNAGEVRADEAGNWYTWHPRAPGAPMWSRPFTSKKDPVKACGRFWEPYSPEQVKATIQVLRYVYKRFGVLEPALIVGHEQVQSAHTKYVGSNKLDPGPLFPLDGVRLAVYEDVEPEAYLWYQAFVQYPDSHKWRFKQITDMCTAEAMLAVENFDSKIVVKACLSVLGYHVSDLDQEAYATADITSVRVFQKMMGLKVDGEPGPITRRELSNRLQNRGYLP